ncbi:hypothetical protein [Methanolobus sp. ZRKC5]|uniref:hypothetical protein n=1 Tax=unclassified Methanolobus TaxID=2629569 RepID=UPI00313C535D
MNKTVLLKHNKNDTAKLKKEIEDICDNISVHNIDQDYYAEVQPIGISSLLVFKLEKDTSGNFVEKALRIASKNKIPILLIVSEPDSRFFDQISIADGVWYIKEPYTKSELRYKIKGNYSAWHDLPIGTDFIEIEMSAH